MLLLSAMFAAIAVPTVLPDSVLFSDAPATLAEMHSIEGKWATSRNVPAITFSAIRPGWMLLKFERGAASWMRRTSFPVAVSTHDGQLFINVAVRSLMPKAFSKRTYQGKECYGTAAIVQAGDGIDLLSLDDEKMRAANSWYPDALPAWEGMEASCGDLVVRAEAAVHQRVIVILDPKSWFGGSLHRIPADGVDKQRGRH